MHKDGAGQTNASYVKTKVDALLQEVGVDFTALELLNKPFSFVFEENTYVGKGVLVGLITAVEYTEDSGGGNLLLHVSTHGSVVSPYPTIHLSLNGIYWEAVMWVEEEEVRQPGENISGHFVQVEGTLSFH